MSPEFLDSGFIIDPGVSLYWSAALQQTANVLASFNRKANRRAFKLPSGILPMAFWDAGICKQARAAHCLFA